MTPSPVVGVGLHWLGGAASASFYVPYGRIRGWSWEVLWLAGGLVSWAVAPWLAAALLTADVGTVIAGAPSATLGWCLLWGALWGAGGLTFGLTMRVLGLSLGMAVALGLTTVIGTLGPPLFREALPALVASTAGQVTLAGIGVALAGILLVARAGVRREAETGTAVGRARGSLWRGLAIATFSGVMSGCFAWGLDAGAPIRARALEAGTDPLWQGLPVLCVVLAGGLFTNAVWCGAVIARQGRAGDWLRARDGGSAATNWALAAMGGLLWYLQFFFYTMGESQMGRFGFSSWTLHMASIIVFATLWGFGLGEWRGTSRGTRRLVQAGIAALVGSTIVIGWGNSLA
jgi:L-rhamnose-H+ transport protein